LVTCDDSPDLGSLEVQTPRLVIEVLSDSTEASDRGDKIANYQTLPSFDEYLLWIVAQGELEPWSMLSGFRNPVAGAFTQA
jgi:Uma2 family endonuclease